jgi:hypothetical protein
MKMSALQNSARLQALFESWGIDVTEKKKRKKRAATPRNGK